MESIASPLRAGWYRLASGTLAHVSFGPTGDMVVRDRAGGVTAVVPSARSGRIGGRL